MAKRYGGKTDGAIQVSISKKSAKDTRYFEVVYDEKKQKSVVEIYSQRLSGEFDVGDIEKIGTYDPSKGTTEFTNKATGEEKDFFSKKKNIKTHIKDPAKLVLTKGLTESGILTKEEAKTESEKVLETDNLSYSTPNEEAVNNSLSTFQKTTQGIARRDYEVLTYPKTLDIKTQDSIKFTLKELKSIKFSASLDVKPFAREYDDLTGSVTLPIQSGISDSNLVKWGPNELDAIRATAAAASLNVANSRSSEEVIGKLGNILTDAQKTLFDKGGPFKQAILASLAGEAVGVQGLLSRATGTVLNPNLELLFQGPQLRPFTFQFRLSPREATEATEVKKIIRFFKQAMSVKTTSSNAFLKTPHVFDIVYQTNGGNIHQSLNRIKTCALLGCDVDYTPDGTYSTFNDESKTMTSYNLTLRFNELEPIFDRDYGDPKDLEGAENFMLLPTLEEEVNHTIGF